MSGKLTTSEMLHELWKTMSVQEVKDAIDAKRRNEAGDIIKGAASCIEEIYQEIQNGTRN